ncbi:hypothetical protein EIP86_008112 [Pleurotus ostreatoroseus]|nr:hypothetical protein EIP86_008112 [Pleurotus ostreatoroseus]
MAQALALVTYAVLFVCISVLVYVTFAVSLRLFRLYRSPLRNVPGPPSFSWFFGSVRGVTEADADRLIDHWAQKYGRTFKYSSFFNADKLFTLDLKALQFVLNSPNFEKSEQLKFALGQLLGNEKSAELRDIWYTQLIQYARPDGKLEVDAFQWMNRVTLDIIGLAGFNYEFHSMHISSGETHELHEAVRKMFDFEAFTVSFLVQALFPLTRVLPTQRSRSTAQSLEVIRRIGTRMIAEKKAEILATTHIVKSKDVTSRDILSLLIKSNMATDLQESDRMSDEEILSQIPAFLVAGHETTSASVTWALFALATHPLVQSKLRSELLQVRTNNPTMEELNALTYLDATIRETMRLHAPVAFTERVATTNMVVPLDRPYIDKNGVHQTALQPERWFKTNDEVRAVPSAWSNIMSFLSGPHACIGYRFAVLEMKSLLFTLVKSFEFELAIQAEDVGRKSNIVGRPYICSNPGAGPQLPLLIREVQGG